MMEWELIFSNVALLVGLILLVAIGITHFFPPKQINYMYGYRTPRSMKSKETWDFAQSYSNRLGLQYACFAIVCGLSLLFLGINLEYSLICGLAITLGMPLYIMIPTERALRKKFPNQ